VGELDDIRSTAAEDKTVESAVLQHVLALHPATVTLDEVVREMSGGDESFAERDSVERAVRDLAAAGLLHLSESLVLPSRAALRFDELLGE
jgi:hypothetical protein